MSISLQRGWPECGLMRGTWAGRVAITFVRILNSVGEACTLIRNRWNVWLGTGALMALGAVAGTAQMDYAAERLERKLKATPTTEPITVDGLLSEPAWA